MRSQVTRFGVVGAVAAALVVTAGAVVANAERPQVGPVVQQATGVTNPAVTETCGLDAVLVLDASGSIDSSRAVDQVRDAGEAFLDALADTGSTARVLQFATFSEELAPQVPVTQASVDDGLFRAALNRYYSPIPPRPAGSNIYSYRGSGDPQSSSSWNSSNGSNMYTNWDQSLSQAGEPQPNRTEIVVYVTDGDPTAYDFNQLGDPFNDDDVGVNTDRGQASAVTMARAQAAADSIKSTGTRMLAVGVGAALQNPASSARLVQIAGPQVVDDDDLASITSINEVDVALVEDFDDLAAFLRGVVIALCTPSISVSKLAQSPVTGEYELTPGWDITVTPTVAGGTFSWTLPDLNPPSPPFACDLTGTASRTCPTNANGVANFQWEPDPPINDSSAVISEALQPGYTAGHPDGDDFKCRIKDITGNVEHFDGEFDPQAQVPSFEIPDVDPRAIVTCALYNSFNFDPEISLTKTDAPRSVRGDDEAAADGINETISTFVVTNTGNAPLFNVDLTDDRCNPQRVDSTDVGSDDMLAVQESWTYTCTRTPVSAPGSVDPITLVNNAEVHATDAVGNPATDTASDSIEVYAADIDLVKEASPTRIQAGVATDVTYTYTATNTGNMPLTDVSVVDDLGSQTCAPVLPASVALAPGASQTFTCTVPDLTAALPTDIFTNTAIVSGQPAFPVGALTPLGSVGDPVTDTASAVVTSFTEGIELTKSVEPGLIFDDTEVTYTYTVTNTGTIDLENVVLTDDLQDPDVVVNGSCAPVVGPTNDDGDGLLNAGETWNYSCETTIDVDALPGSDRYVVNVARVDATAVGTDDALVDFAPAVVEIVTPQISISKDAVPKSVLDPDAIDPAVGNPGAIPQGGAVRGPDVEPPRPAGYTYIVTNTGNVPIDDPVVTDVRPALGNAPACAPITPVPAAGNNVGDLNDDGILDPGEAWEYVCGTELDKDDSDTPAGPTEPGVVTNSATASGTAFIPGQPGDTQAVTSPPAVAVVEVLQPRINLQKTPCVRGLDGNLTCDDNPDDGNHLLVRPNTIVTYQYTVTNTGDSDLAPQFGLDTLCVDIGYVSGDDGDGLINVGEAWLFECDDEVGGLENSPVVNTAGVAAMGPLGNYYVDVDQATVRIFDPSIEVVKTVSEEFVPVGTEVTYTFTVTNTGEYAVTLGSPADVQLEPVVLVDASRPANPACTSPTYVSGDIAPLGVLTVDPAESWVYTCTGTINESTVNVAGVRGTDIAAGFVYDGAIASVTAYEAGIDVVKSASPTELPLPGGPVTYTYLVTNTGNVPLADVESRIVDDTCSPVTYVSGDDDMNGLLTSDRDMFESGPGEVWVFTCSMEITQDTTNVVVVEGTPVRPTPDGPEVLGPDVSDDDVAFVDVFPPPEPLPPTPSSTTTTLATGALPSTGGGGSGRTTAAISVILLAGGVALVLAARRRRTA